MSPALSSFGGRYQPGRRIHAGVYFESFQATDTALDRQVFLKVAAASADPVVSAVVEAHVGRWRSLASAHFDGLPAILDVMQDDGRWHLVTEWIDGVVLRALISGERAIGDPQALLSALLESGLRILGGMHARGFVHADLSPGNILVEMATGEPLIHLVDPAPLLDIPDPNDAARKLIIGTTSFMAPEVLAGHRPTFRSDLFALGKVVAAAAASLGMAAPAFTGRLTANDPASRPSTATEALSEFRQSADQATTALPDAPPVRRPPDDAGTMLASAPRLPLNEGATVVASAPRPSIDPGSSVDAGPTRVVSVATPAAAPPELSEVSRIASVPAPTRDAANLRADFSVVAPKTIQPGSHFVVEVWVAASEQRAQMIEQATRSGRMVERGNRSGIDLSRDTLITIVLRLPDFEIEDAVETLGWNGDIRNAGFIVKAPASLAPGIYPGAAKLMQNQVPFASILFDLEVAAPAGLADTAAKPLEARIQPIARAFASYASLDRAEVLRRVQGIAALGTNVFLDIVNLRSGKEWESTLYREIEASDGFFLFWSRNAAKSDWVAREWRYALEHRGLEFINPLPLEDPRNAKPPPELRSKHFNDMLLAFIKAEDAYKQS